VPEGTDAVIVELGANDTLRGIDPKVTREALEGIVGRLRQRRIEVLLAGMRAAPNLGPDYGRDFDAIYPDLAAQNDLLLYPFSLTASPPTPSSISATACIRPRRRGRDRCAHPAQGGRAGGAVRDKRGM
jgi:lysophospholipase L1-like esterase